MSETVKPDTHLVLKRKWFAKIWNGEKTVEYRSLTPYWKRRLEKLGQRFFVEFMWGMKKNGPRILCQVHKVDIGKCPYPGWPGKFYRIHFVLIQAFMKVDGVYFPFLEIPRMKEQGGKRK